MIKKLQEKIRELIREIDILRRNVRELQEQLKNSYIRIKNLTDELHMLRRKLRPESMFHGDTQLPSGWAMPPSENPDAPHLQKEKDKNE